MAKLFGWFALLSAMKPFLLVLFGMLITLLVARVFFAGPVEPGMPRVDESSSTTRQVVVDTDVRANPTEASPLDLRVPVVGPELDTHSVPPGLDAAQLATLTGRLVEPDGRPAAARRCRLLCLDPVTCHPGGFEPDQRSEGAAFCALETTTGDDGVFTFTQIPAGRPTRCKPIGGPNSAAFVCAARRSGPRHLALELRGAIIRRVVGPDGAPIAGRMRLDVPEPRPRRSTWFGWRAPMCAGTIRRPPGRGARVCGSRATLQTRTAASDADGVRGLAVPSGFGSRVVVAHSTRSRIAVTSKVWSTASRARCSRPRPLRARARAARAAARGGYGRTCRWSPGDDRVPCRRRGRPTVVRAELRRTVARGRQASCSRGRTHRSRPVRFAARAWQYVVVPTGCPGALAQTSVDSAARSSSLAAQRGVVLSRPHRQRLTVSLDDCHGRTGPQ
jgi:hypothetical protein